MFRTIRRAFSMSSLRRRTLTSPRRVNPFPSMIDRLEDRVTPSFGASGLLSPNAAQGLPIAEVSAGSRLASVSTADSAILNGLLGGVLGNGAGLNLTAVDYNAIAGADVNLGNLLGELQTTLGVATPSEVLTNNITLAQLFSAAAAAAQADGNTAAATAFGNTLPLVGGLAGTIQLGDILNIGLPDGSLGEAQLNGLDLLTGGVQLFNFENVATTPGGVSISGVDLGVASVINDVTVFAQVVEPPVFVIGPVGTQFATAQVRLKLNVDLVDVNLGTAQLNGLVAPVLGVLQPLLDPLNLGLLNLTANATVGDFDLYTDVARGTGLIDAINLVQNSVTLQATPSVADVYLGSISDALFYNRTRPITPADLTPGTVGQLTLGLTVAGIPTAIPGLDPNLGITLRALGEADPVVPLTEVFTGPFPSSRTVGSSAAVIGNLVGDLVSSLQVGLTGNLGVLNGLLGTLTSTVGGVVAPAVTPVLTPLLTNAVDPLLNTLGIGIGEMDLTVAGLDVRNAPDARNDSVVTLQDRPVTVNVLANDSIPSPGTTNFAVVAQPGNGTLTVNADKTIKYVPNVGFLGSDSFTYSLTDEFGQTDTATVTVFVGQGPGPNGAPRINPDVSSTAFNTPVTVNVLANDTDPNGDTLTVVGVSVPSNGKAVVNANGTVTYTPNTGFTGFDTFTYAASDGKGGVGMATVTIGVGNPPPPANLPPQAVADAANTAQGTATTVNVLANDTDPDGGTLAIVGLSQPAGGTVVLGTGGKVTYTPNAGFFGDDRFTYTITDGQGGFSAATVTVSVARNNGAPTINPDTIFTPAGTAVSISVLNNDTDPNGDTLAVTGVTQPATGGTVAITGNTVTFTPTPGFIGTTTFTYTASDGFGGSGTATVTVRVGNNNPVAGPDAAQTPARVGVTIPVLANDSDPDGDPFSITGTTSPANGTIAINGTNITYSPRAGFLGNDSFTYTITDSLGGTATATVRVTVGNGQPPLGTNTPPTVNADATSTPRDTGVNIPVLANDTDADGDPITLVGVTQGANGTVTINADGTLLYVPRAGFTGVDTFTYTATDGQGGTASGNVQVTVTGGNNPGPVISDLKQYAVGADTSGGPRVTVYNPDGSVRFNFFAYDPNTRFGVNVSMGDLDGDGISEIVTSPGKGGSAHVKVFSGKDLTEIFSFFAFDSNFRGGCNIAIGDTNGDGRNDLVVSAGQGGGPRVRVLDGTTLTRITGPVESIPGVMLADFFAYDVAFGGGSSVAVVDRDGDGVGEVVTGAGPGGAPVVRVWNVNGPVQMLSEFLAFDPSISAGVNIGGRGAFMVIGIGKGGPPQVRVFQGTEQTLVADLLAYEPTFTGGVRVNFGETVDPTKQVFLVGAGVGGGPRIKVLRPNLEVLVPDYFAFEESFRGGVFVS